MPKPDIFSIPAPVREVKTVTAVDTLHPGQVFTFKVVKRFPSDDLRAITSRNQWLKDHSPESDSAAPCVEQAADGTAVDIEAIPALVEIAALMEASQPIDLGEDERYTLNEIIHLAKVAPEAFNTFYLATIQINDEPNLGKD